MVQSSICVTVRTGAAGAIHPRGVASIGCSTEDRQLQQLGNLLLPLPPPLPPPLLLVCAAGCCQPCTEWQPQLELREWLEGLP